MPSVQIRRDQITKLQQDQCTVSTPLGHMLLEIQGTLQLPVLEDTSCIKFGTLTIDEAKDGARAELSIGEMQLLVGELAKVDPPLGLLHMHQGCATLEDVLRWKVVFRARPLPVTKEKA